MNSFRWTKNEEKELIALKNIYGMKRPSDISYQLNKIYGIERTPN